MNRGGKKREKRKELCDRPMTAQKKLEEEAKNNKENKARSARSSSWDILRWDAVCYRHPRRRKGERVGRGEQIILELIIHWLIAIIRG